MKTGKTKKIRIFLWMAAAVLVVVAGSPASALVSISPSYAIPSQDLTDSGSTGSSPSYVAPVQIVGDSVAGKAISPSYTICQGFVEETLGTCAEVVTPPPPPPSPPPTAGGGTGTGSGGISWQDWTPPVTSNQTQEIPVTQEPVTQEPVTQEPVTQEPVTQEPVTQEPVVEPEKPVQAPAVTPALPTGLRPAAPGGQWIDIRPDLLTGVWCETSSCSGSPATLAHGAAPATGISATVINLVLPWVLLTGAIALVMMAGWVSGLREKKYRMEFSRLPKKKKRKVQNRRR
jgi:hypothetical protein